MVIQQYEKAKVIQDEQLERLTQICQEQGVTAAPPGPVWVVGCWWCPEQQGPRGQHPELGRWVSKVMCGQPG